MKIKNKLALRFTFIVWLILLFFSLGIYEFSYLETQRENHVQIQKKAFFISNHFIKNGEIDTNFIQSINKKDMNEMLGEKIYICDPVGKILYNSFEKSSAPITLDQHMSVLNDGLLHFKIDNEVAYGIRFQSKANKFIVVIAHKNPFENELSYLKLFLFIGLIASIIIVFISGRYFAGRALRPVTKILRIVEKISESNLDARIDEGKNKDELFHLAQTFNNLLQRLEKAFILQRNFVSNASHELRTPLSSITAQLEVALINTRDIEEYKSILQSVLEDIKELNSLSEGLFDITLANQDVTLMKFNKIRVDEILLQSRTELLKRKQNYKVNIHFGSFPDDEKKLIIQGEEHLLKSTFINLIDNACKYSNDQACDVYLDISTTEFIIKVVDKGIGIPEDFMKKIFTPLMRAENTKKIIGHGLGLALAKKIIEIHKGKIEVFSQINVGTTFVVNLPNS